MIGEMTDFSEVLRKGRIETDDGLISGSSQLEKALAVGFCFVAGMEAIEKITP